MGLRDILMKNGPGGRPSRTGSDGGVWLIMKAILGLLAYNVCSRAAAVRLLRCSGLTVRPDPKTSGAAARWARGGCPKTRWATKRIPDERHEQGLRRSRR